jgi:L-threonylcarbamoyladenylate synthase
VSRLDEVVEAVAAGGLVVIPTDTVYGLACRPDSEECVQELSRLKQRSPEQPIALVAASLDAVLELVPELPVDRLLQGPFTLVLRNPGERLRWLTGSRPGTIGVRLPELTGPARDLFDRVGAVAATSANLHGGSDPRRLSDVPAEILDAVAAVLDAGELAGMPSTVVDLTEAEPRILREGAVPAAEALARVAGDRSE